MADQIIVNKSFETATSAVKPNLGLQPGKRGNMRSRDDNGFALSHLPEPGGESSQAFELAHAQDHGYSTQDTQQQCVTWRVLPSAFHEPDSTLAGFKARHDLDLT